jgi:hypothetical protein
MLNARRPLRCIALRLALATLAAGFVLVSVVACASTGSTPVPTSSPISPAAVAPIALPAAATSMVTVQPSAVIHLKTADEFERIKGRGQPVLLAVLDKGQDDSFGGTDG